MTETTKLRESAGDQKIIWTVGHSTRLIGELLEILRAAEIRLLADVRRFPGSRRHPQFNQERLIESLAGAGIAYRHFVDLGGRRTERLPNSPNTGWRVESFNAYADYMQLAEFLAALDELMDVAQTQPTAIMCSEALPHKCHRRLIADALLARGWQVLHIYSIRRIKSHDLTPFALIDGLTVTYPAANVEEIQP